MAARNMALTRSNRDLGELYTILAKAFPNHKNVDGAFDVYKLANDIGVTPTTLYNSFKLERLGTETARKLIKASSGKLTQRKLAAFLNLV